MTPLVDHLSPNVRQQADRRATSRMQLDAVERRLVDGPEAAIGAPRGFRGGEFPLVFAAMKIIVRAGLHETVEAADGCLQVVAIDPEFRRQFRQIPGARHRLRHVAAGRLVGEGIFLQILRVENEIGGQIRIFMPQRVEQPKLRHDPLEECFIGKAHAISVHHHRVGAAQFDNPGMDACRRPARHPRRNGVGQHHPQAVLDLMQ